MYGGEKSVARLKKRADGRYCKQVLIGTENGKKQYKFFYGTTSKEVEVKVRDFLTALGRGLDASQAGVTFGALCTQYIRTKKAQGISASWESSLCLYTGYFSSLFNVPASKIKSQDLQSILNNLAEYHDGNKPLGHKTLMEARRAVRAVFDMAIPEIVQYNPATKTILPAGQPQKEREALPDYQRKWIEETPHRAQIAAMLMLYAGLRRGEVCALTWADIDFNKKLITVNKALEMKVGKEKGTKTAAGVRMVRMPAVLYQFLLSQPHNVLYVVHSARGTRMTDTAWRRMWDSYMIELNIKYGYAGAANKYNPEGLKMRIKPFTAHQLRHTYASMLYMAGVDVLTARDQLGHTDIKTTLSIYTHLDKRYKNNSMDKLDSFLDKSKTSQQII